MTIGGLKEKILSVGLVLAQQHGYPHVTRTLVARKLDISEGAVSYHWKDMNKLRAAIVREAIETENIQVLGQAIAARHPYLRDIPDELRRRVARTLANTI